MAPTSLTGRTALVTGGSRGIGRAIALRLAEAGAYVFVASRNIESCEAAVAEIEAAGGTATAHVYDLSDKHSLAALMGAIGARGALDILVANAANNPAFGPMAGVSENKYDRVFATNLKGNFNLCIAAAPLLAKSGRGSIVVLSSISGLRGTPTLGVYSMAKLALVQLVRNLAVELGPRGVRANALSPGLTRTDLGEIALHTPEGKRLIARTPLGRAAESDDVADAALFLASDMSRFITGQNLIVDGGVTVSDYS